MTNEVSSSLSWSGVPLKWFNLAMISYLQDGVSLELTKDGNTLTKSGPGVKPLLELIASGLDYSGASLKDRVTGRAAALLYLYLGIRLVETDLISSSALSLLKEKGIEVSYHQEIPAILNHARDDFCPLEKATQGITSPIEGLKIIRETLAKMARK